MPENNQNSNQYGVTTNEIMDYLKDNMATKDDLKSFATKDDLKSFATRVDLNKMKLDIIDHVDEKLADLKGDLVKNILTPAEAKSVFQMEPFPQLMV